MWLFLFYKIFSISIQIIYGHIIHKHELFCLRSANPDRYCMYIILIHGTRRNSLCAPSNRGELRIFLKSLYLLAHSKDHLLTHFNAFQNETETRSRQGEPSIIQLCAAFNLWYVQIQPAHVHTTPTRLPYTRFTELTSQTKYLTLHDSIHHLAPSEICTDGNFR